MSEKLDLRSLGPLPVSALCWQPSRGEWSLSICVKGTFDLVARAEATLAGVQAPLRVGASRPNDLVPIKPRADVIVLARALGPEVRLRVGSIDKRVAGNGAPLDLGTTSFASRASRLTLSKTARAWAEEARAGTPNGVAPPELDFAVFNEAPADQQAEVLRRRDTVVLEGLPAGAPRFEGRLPGLWPKVLHVPVTGVSAEVGMRCDTLQIDVDRQTMSLWWRGLVAVTAGDLAALGAIVVVVEDVNQRARVEAIESWVRTPDASPPVDLFQDASVAAPSPLGQRRDKTRIKAPVDDEDAPTIKLAAPPAGGGSHAPPDGHAVEVTVDALPEAFARSVLPFQVRPPAALAMPAPELGPTPSIASAGRRVEPLPPDPPRLVPAQLLGEVPDVAQVATVAAELACGSASAVLAAHGLTSTTWESVERRCLERLANEAAEGRTVLRDAYDSAFLAAAARQRGPLPVERLARLRVDLESDGAGEGPADLGLEIADAMRARRLWSRAAGDTTRASSVAVAMKAERDRRRTR